MKTALTAAVLFHALLASATYIDFVGQNGEPTVGAVDVADNWAGGVAPSGSVTGRIAQAENVWAGIVQDLYVRLEGGRIYAVNDGVAMRGNVLIEVDTGDWGSVTNFDVSGKTLTLWAQNGGTNELNILSGRVNAGVLKMVSPGKSIINLSNGILYIDDWDACKGTVNMRSGGTGTMMVSTVSSNEDFLADCSFDFESGNKGSITLGEVKGGTSASGTWESLVASGNVLVDGAVQTNAEFFDISTNSNSSTIRPVGALPGLAVIGGTLYREGIPYRGIGVNYFDLFYAMMKDGPGPDGYRTIDGLRTLGEKGIPFARFAACGFWPVDWDLYFSDKDEWFACMDLVVQTAEEAGVGLIPSVFWRMETYPALFNEYRSQVADPDSDTWQFMSNYIHEVVGRYKDSPAIWGWEYGNEFNNMCDLPNWTNGLASYPALGVTGAVTEVNESNKYTYAIQEAAFDLFTQEVRKLDTHRFICSGNSKPRPSAWHNRMETNWVVDTYSQAKEAFSWMAPPSSIDMASFHVYPYSWSDPGVEPVYAEAVGVSNILLRFREFCDDQNQVMFVGEYSSFYAGQGPPPEEERTEEIALLGAIVNSGADLAAYWVYDRGVNRTEEGTIYPDSGEYMGVLDLILEYDGKMRGEIWRTANGVPPAWFDQFGIVPTNWQTWAEIETQDLNGNGLSLWQDYFAGFQPLETAPEFAITDFQWLGNSAPSLSWQGGTNGPMTPYVIQSTTNLPDSASWQTIGTKAREQGTNTWVGTPTDASSCYYRVLAVPAD